MQCLSDRLMLVGFGEEQPAFRQVVLGNLQAARGKDQFDRRPARSNELRELQSVHRPWHLDICKDDPDVGPLFQNGDSSIRAFRLDRLKSLAFDEADRGRRQVLGRKDK